MILIAGVGGYIGSHVNKLLCKRGYKTVIFDNLVYGHREFVKWGEFFLGDLVRKDQIKDCFERYPIDAVMHFSAFAYVGESVVNPAKYYINNVANTLNLLDVMREFQVRYFIFSSTCATYGIPVKVPIPEDHPQNPVNPYGRSKLMIEEILKDYDSAYSMKYINLRYFNAAGADPEGEIGERHDPETHLIPLTLDAALGRGEDIRIFGTDYPTRDGTCIRDYIHVMDLADVHVKALEYVRERETSDSFNLGNGIGHSVKEVIDSVRRISTREFKVTETGRRAGDPPVLISSSQKAIETLQWRPQYADIDLIVETAWKWHSKQVSV